MKRSKSKKSQHSWWWDNHIGHKNSEWLQNNLEEMEEIVKWMLKIVDCEENVDSFAKKAELYFKKRPDLVNLMEEFYRMYRSLAERYRIVNEELQKSISFYLASQGSGNSDGYRIVNEELQKSISFYLASQGSGNSDVGSEPAGVDVFLGGGPELSDSKRDQSSSSELETEDSSINNDNIVTTSNDAETQELRQKNIELEIQLREVKEKLRMIQQEIDEGHKKSHEANAEFSSKIAVYEEELRVAKEKTKHSEEEVTHLTMELQKYQRSLEDSNNHVTDPKVLDSSPAQELKESISGSQAEDSDTSYKIQRLEEELRIAEEQLHDSVEEIDKLKQKLMSKGSLIQYLQNQLESAQTETSDVKNKLEKGRIEVSDLQDQITSLSD